MFLMSGSVISAVGSSKPTAQQEKPKKREHEDRNRKTYYPAQKS